MKTNRRKFIKQISALGVTGTIYPWLSSCVGGNSDAFLNETITKIEVFRYDINIPRYFSLGTWHNRQHLFIKISSGDFYGWTETPASKNNPDFKPTTWVNYLKQFKGLTSCDRPAWKGLETITQGMGRIYNLHPSTMGSLIYAAQLANKVKK